MSTLACISDASFARQTQTEPIRPDPFPSTARTINFYDELLPPGPSAQTVDVAGFKVLYSGDQPETQELEASSLDEKLVDVEDDDVFDTTPIAKIIENAQAIRPINILLSSMSPEISNSLTLLEKLIKSHTIWYLPHVGRVAAMHLLRNKGAGIFLVRYSSQPNSMALSVKLPKNCGADVEHFLIETTIAGVRLEGSTNFFPALPMLICHYFEDENELPVKLTLPDSILSCTSMRVLCSLALLGQEFWSSEYSVDINDFNMPDPSTLQTSAKEHGTTKPSRSFSVSHGHPPTFHQSALQNQNIIDLEDKEKSSRNQTDLEKSIDKLKSPTRSHSISSSILKCDFSKFSDQAAKNSDKKFNWRSFFDSVSPSSNHKRTMSCNSQPVSISSAKGTFSTVWYRGNVPNNRPALSDDLFLKEPEKYTSGMSPNLYAYDNDASDMNTAESTRWPDCKNSHENGENCSKFTFSSFKPKIHVLVENAKKDVGCSTKDSPPCPIKNSTSFHHFTQEKINENQNMKFCVEEMRKKRLDSVKNLQKMQISNKNSPQIYRSKRDGSPHIIRRENSGDSKTKRFGQLLKFKKKSEDATEKCTRKSKNAIQLQEHRLSAPNLLESDFRSKNKNLSEIVKELKQKQQQKLDISQQKSLHTINEGLVTPMLMRRDLKKLENSAKNCKAKRRCSKSADDVKEFSDSSSSDDTLKWKSVAKNFYCLKSDLPPVLHGEKPARPRNFQLNSEPVKNGRIVEELKMAQKATPARPTRKIFVDPSANSSDYGFIVPNVGNFDLSQKIAAFTARDRSSGESSYGILSAQDDKTYEKLAAKYQSARLSSGSQNTPSVRDCRAKSEIENDLDDAKSVVSTAGTLFSEPWDSSAWENLLHVANLNEISTTLSKTPKNSLNSQENDHVATETGPAVQTLSEKHQTYGLKRSAIEGLKSLPSFITSPHWEQFSNQVVPCSSCSTIATNSLEKRAPEKFDQCGVKDSNAAVLLKPPLVNQSSCEESEKFSLGPVLTPARFRDNRYKHRISADPGSKIQLCVERLSGDLTTFFGVQIKNFIDCTLQAREIDPTVVLGNVRQFMNGIKNYLVKHGERDLHDLIEKERAKLHVNEFLNIDAILEGVLQKILLQKLKSHLYHVLIKESSRSGSLNLISSNFALLRNRPPEELGIKLYNHDDVLSDKVRNFLRKMQNHYSPLKKLENLLLALSMAHQMSLQHPNSPSDPSNFQYIDGHANIPSGDELLNWFVFMLSRYSVVGCEIEAAYMRHLLHPALLSGEASYYLAAFSSAVHLLKHLDMLARRPPSTAGSLGRRRSPSQTCNDDPSSECLLKVAIPNETYGSISYHAFPLAPQLTVAKFCRMIAHKCGVTNPEDHGLYLLMDGLETCLLPSECPYLVNEQLQMAGAPRRFAYKRHEAKIAWPKIAMSPS